MSVTLEDSSGKSLKVNAWNWGVLHHAVACAKPPIIEDESELELLRFGGATLSAAQCDELREYLQEVVLPRLAPGQRLLSDFTATDEPDDGTFHRDDLAKNYSLSREVLESVIVFLGEAEAPVTVW